MHHASFFSSSYRTFPKLLRWLPHPGRRDEDTRGSDMQRFDLDLGMECVVGTIASDNGAAKKKEA
jgi:hypothetical protein